VFACNVGGGNDERYDGKKSEGERKRGHDKAESEAKQGGFPWRKLCCDVVKHDEDGGCRMIEVQQTHCSGFGSLPICV
jgi:hypothetical protein